MVANRLITVAAGLTALCCPTWAKASLCYRNDLSECRCSCVSQGCHRHSACDAKKSRADLHGSVRGASVHRCGCVICSCPIEGSVNASVLRWDQGQPVILVYHLRAESLVKKQVAQVTKKLVYSHNRRQACLGVWLK